MSALPGVAEEERKDSPGQLAWSVAGTGFAWDPGLHEKEALLAAGLPGFFTIPHFEGYAAVLVELGATRKSALRQVLIEGWLAVAPTPLAEEFLARREQR